MQTFRRRIADALAPLTDQSPDEALALLARPPKPDMGDIALPCFTFAKARRQAPPKIAAELADQLVAAGIADIAEIAAAGPYVNFRVAPEALMREAVATVERLAAGALFDPPVDPETGAPPVLTIDYSSPNVAKEFHVAHLRSTALGHSIVQLNKTLGWRTVGINHLGDWGTQFGHLINAFRAHGDPAELEREPIKHLQSLYVAATQAAKTDESLQEAARATFRALEEGDPETRELWGRFRELSIAEFQRLYDLIGIEFDTYEGEAFYNDKLDAVVARFEAAGVAEREDEGAIVVRLEGEEAPLLLRKSDGASTYATRDLAAVAYRDATYRFARNVYCVDVRQAQHFRQVFAAYALLGEHEARMAADCHHVPFGAVTVDGMIMATREGNVLLLEDYIEQLADAARAKVREKNPELSDDETLALGRQVAVGALIFEMLKREQVHRVDFKAEESLNTAGETGPRLQYLHGARLCSLLRTYPQKVGEGAARPLATVAEAAALLRPELLVSNEEKELAKLLLAYPEAIEQAAREFAPNHIGNWLHQLTDTFNGYYREHTVIDPDNLPLTEARMALVRLLQAATAHALGLLGIPAPERL